MRRQLILLSSLTISFNINLFAIKNERAEWVGSTQREITIMCEMISLLETSQASVAEIIVPIHVSILFFVRRSAKSFAHRVIIETGSSTNNAKK